MSSYNELSSDANLVGWWNGDANGDSTGDAVNAADAGTYDATWTGTEAYGTPPFGDGKALDTTGSNTHLEASVAPSGSASRTLSTLIYVNSADFAGPAPLLSWDSGSDGSNGQRFTLRVDGGDLRVEIQGSGYTSSLAIPNDTWTFIAARSNGSTLASTRLTVGTSHEQATGGSTINTTANHLNIGSYSIHTTRYVPGLYYDTRYYDRYLSDAELGQLAAGDEPTYTSGASLDEDGNYSVGTWDSHNNGTATYIATAVNLAGDVLESGTTATGTLDLSGNSGNICYLMVKPSNNGGSDVGDYATRTSGFGSAGDGYYEIASVVAAGGGGPDYTITQSAAAAVEVSGLTGSLVVARNVTQSAPAAIDVAGLSGSLEVSRSLTQSSPAAVEVSGLAGSLSASRQITQSAPAVVEVSGLEGSLTYSGEGGPTYTLTQTAPAAVEVAGLSGSLAVSRQIIQSAPASVEVEGQGGTLTLAYQLSQSAPAAVEVSGLAGSLIVARRIVQSAAAAVAVQGRTGALTYSEEVDTPTTVTGNYAAVAAPQNAGAVAAPQNYAAVRVSN